jgi:hypothetical protein
MKKLIYILALLLFSCSNKNSPVENKNTTIPEDTVQSTVKTDLPADSVLPDFSGYVLSSIKELDVEKIAGYIHPTLGVRFSPYAYIDVKKDIQMQAGTFKEQWTKKPDQKLDWGSFDGSGESVKLSIKQYFKRFVYDVDFLEAPDVSLNKVVGVSTTINNIKEVYADCDFVEYHFSGFDKDMEGMDWRSLRLVYKRHEGNFYLVGIIHDEWTT